jgi:hypothetical protein
MDLQRVTAGQRPALRAGGWSMTRGSSLSIQFSAIAAGVA